MSFAHEKRPEIDAPVDFPAALGWVDGDHALLTELIGIFLEDCPKRLQELDQAVKERNAIGVRQAAHSLKGMVACFATRAAHGFAHEMENLGKAGDLSKAQALLPTLLHEFARVMHHLKTTDWQETS